MEQLSIANLLSKREEDIIQKEDYMSNNTEPIVNKTIGNEVYELINAKRKRRENKIRIYKDKLNKCVHQVKRKDELLLTDMIFDMGVLEYGHPEYDPDECMEYMLIELRKYGFDAKKLSKSKIFVSWKFLELNNRDK